MPPKLARLAGLGALGAAAGLLALIVLVIIGLRPTEYSGMDGTLRTVAWIGIGGVLVALALVHVMFGRRLLEVARDHRPTP
jgi:hypothetical protein